MLFGVNMNMSEWCKYFREKHGVVLHLLFLSFI